MKVEYLSISEFAERAGVSKQAIYKQVNNENSQIAPYLLREGKKTLIKETALKALYKVDVEYSTFTPQINNPEQPEATQEGRIEVDEQPQQTTAEQPNEQPNNPNSTADNQPISTDYIAFLKAQVAELKAEKEAVETRLNATIAEKDSIIKDQTAQLAQLAQQVAQIADKALITTAQQQYLTAKASGEAVEVVAGEPPEAEQIKTNHKKSFWKRLFSIEQGLKICGNVLLLSQRYQNTYIQRG